MITLTQTESTLSLSANIRPKGYEGAEFVPEGLTVEVVGRNNGALLQHLNGNIEGDRLSVDIDLDDVQDVDIYDLVINYRLRDARYIRGYRAVNIIETAFEARRSENTSILGGGNTARATVITPVASEGANAGTAQELDLANLRPEQVEALKKALGINANASQGSGQADFSALSPEQIEALKQALGISETAGAGQELDINALLKAEIDPNAFEKVGEVYQESVELFFGGNKTFAEALAQLCYYVNRADGMASDMAGDLLYKGILDVDKYADKYGLIATMPMD